MLGTTAPLARPTQDDPPPDVLQPENESPTARDSGGHFDKTVRAEHITPPRPAGIGVSNASHARAGFQRGTSR